MSEKAGSERVKKLDRRVRRTRNALGDALLELIQEEKFEDITVQQVLERAGVGRSTFYKHYEDKEDLLLSDMEEFFEMFSTLLIRQKDPSRRVAPVREFFAHVGEMRHLHSALAEADKLRDFQEMGQQYFARAIKKRLEQLTAAGETAQSTATAQALAGALLSLMSWWLQSGATQSPEAMDDLYHGMVWAGVKATPSPVPTLHAGPTPKQLLQRKLPNRKSGRKIPRA